MKRASVIVLACLFPAAWAAAAGPDAAALHRSRTRAVNFLRTTQADNGSWTAPDAVGITALTATALLKSGVPVDDPVVIKALANLESFVQEDGGIYHQGTQHRNYETSIALLAFQAANGDGRFQTRINRAVAFLKGIQWDESEGLDPSHTSYGGAGYG
ncbi:MAG: prenyltransferase/squalene oxidase repeat-containing protein, partial [Planctomycetaceae bacterium]